MQTDKILISAFVGTSAMTLFSYLVSASEHKNFREPQVLAELIKRLPKNGSKDKAQIAGWCLHYTVGVSFVTLYNELWKQKIIKPSLTSGAVMGAVSGLVGISGWKGMFELHPNPPSKNLKQYFGHLMLAHVVFGVFSALTYKFTLDEKESKLL